MSLSKTPAITVFDNRALNVRNIQYYVHPEKPQLIEERITRYHYNNNRGLIQSIDPRLFAQQQMDKYTSPNFSYRLSLSNEVLRTDSVDAGSSLNLNDVVYRETFRITATDRNSTVTQVWNYENNASLGRVLSISEQTYDEDIRVIERFVWAGHSSSDKNLNLAGKCICHYDPAGLNRLESVALNGAILSATRQLLKDTEMPDTIVNWQGKDEADWNGLLALENYTTLNTVDARGNLLTVSDIDLSVQRMAYDITGRLKGSWLTLKGDKEKIIVKSLTYSASGQKLCEEYGNGVLTTYTYEPQTQRLIGIKTERLLSRAVNAKVLQDLRYEYDPVGNVVKVANDAEATRFWRNQKIVPENTYIYDSLYQLIAATGRETANISQQINPFLFSILPLPSDDSVYTNYKRTYHYDLGGNLTQIRHISPITNSNYTINITVSSLSNRAVLSTQTEDPTQVDGLFTESGLQRQLLPGQDLIWTSRSELQKVTIIPRDNGNSDDEAYRYDGDSQRTLKVTRVHTNSNLKVQRTLYLPEKEIHIGFSGTEQKECLHVITMGEEGRIRILHWENGKPDTIENNQIRYNYANLIGSCGLELDDNGLVISEEEYYPYGGTSVWTARSQIEAEYKSLRYSNKERDATGLYYYGYRYYQPQIGRWLSPDPSGDMDGLNLYRMCRNNPTTLYDPDGQMPRKNSTSSVNEDEIRQRYISRRRGAVGLPQPDEIMAQPRVRSSSAIMASSSVAMPGWNPGRRRGAIGLADIEQSLKTMTIDKKLKIPLPLPIVKEEALEDKQQAAQSKFVNLMSIREEHRITVQSGKLIYKNQPLTTSESGRFKFIQDDNSALYGVEASDDPEGIKHSSLLGSNWPISAGTISAHDGEIIQLTSSSGHFRPSKEHLDFTENYLRSEGVNILQVSHFFGKSKKTRRVKRSVASYVSKYLNG